VFGEHVPTQTSNDLGVTPTREPGQITELGRYVDDLTQEVDGFGQALLHHQDARPHRCRGDVHGAGRDRDGRKRIRRRQRDLVREIQIRTLVRKQHQCVRSEEHGGDQLTALKGLTSASLQALAQGLAALGFVR
jgi:hypothetical protein